MHNATLHRRQVHQRHITHAAKLMSCALQGSAGLDDKKQGELQKEPLEVLDVELWPVLVNER